MKRWLVDVQSNEAFETKPKAIDQPPRYRVVNAESRQHAVDKVGGIRAIEVCLGAMAAMEEQISQMSGMFDDEDGAIQQALDDSDDARQAAKPILNELRGKV